MARITDILKSKKFTISVELVPPRNGSPADEMWEKLEQLKGKVDFVSVTKGAGGSLRGGTLPISYFAQERYGIKTIAHFVCRERTVHEIENELMDLYYFGIKNILALRGDPPAGQKDEAWDGDYTYAYPLVRQIKDMNAGIYVPRKNVDEKSRAGLKTDFCIIVAGHPEDPIEDEIEHIKAKIEAGAEVIITQMVFSFEEYKAYVDSLRKAGIRVPVLAGIRPLVDPKQAESVEKFFGLKVNTEIMRLLGEAKTEAQAYEAGISYTAAMIKKLKAMGAPGVHLFVLNDVGLVESLLKKI